LLYFRFAKKSKHLFLKTDGAGNLSFSSDLPTTSFTGATVETSIADSDLVLIYDDSATAVRKMTKANLIAGVGGANTPAFKATMSANQSTSGSFVKVNFDTEIYDTNNCYDPTTNYRFTPTTAGKYYITTGMSLTPNVTGSIIPAIYFNGSEVARGNIYANNSTARADVSTSLTFNGTTDYVEIYLYQSTGTNDTNKDYATFEAFKLIGV